MLKIGITGGIGSGKSIVCRIFNTLGAPVFNADEAAQDLMANDIHLVSKIRLLFGEDAYLSDGSVNRAFISSVVFKDKEKLNQLNAFVHPVVVNHFSDWLGQHEDYPYIVKEAAILFESETHKQLDYTILVYAEETTRIKRVMERNGITAEAVKLRMKNQMSEEEKKKLVDFIIYNENDSVLIPQVMELHKKFSGN